MEKCSVKQFDSWKSFCDYYKSTDPYYLLKMVQELSWDKSLKSLVGRVLEQRNDFSHGAHNGTTQGRDNVVKFIRDCITLIKSLGCASHFELYRKSCLKNLEGLIESVKQRAEINHSNKKLCQVDIPTASKAEIILEFLKENSKDPSVQDFIVGVVGPRIIPQELEKLFESKPTIQVPKDISLKTQQSPQREYSRRENEN